MNHLLDALGRGGLLEGLFTQRLTQQPLPGCPHQACPLCAQSQAEQITFALAQQQAQAEREARYRERCQTYLAWFRAGYRKP